MAEQKEQTCDAGCHCGYIKLSLTFSPPFPEHKIMNCNCSICTRAGYLLVYTDHEKVTWHNDSISRLARYQFNTKKMDHMFCPKCGISIGIDFPHLDPKRYGISARTIDDIDLDAMNYTKFNGRDELLPKGHLVGKEYQEA